MIRIIVHGLGRLGRSVCGLAAECGEFDIVAAVKRNLVQGSDSGLNLGFPVYGDLAFCKEKADVIVDCSVASATSVAVAYALASETPIVICTTGLEESVMKQIKETSAKIPVFLSANASLGINLVRALIQTAAKSLNPAGFDIEIVERHHNQKLDAPSGTANWLAEGIYDAIGPKKAVFDRTGERRKRDENEIGIHSIRGGTIVGDHLIIFAGPDEVIEIKHSALSREAFARGTLIAAKFTAARQPGLYTMDDVINAV